MTRLNVNSSMVTVPSKWDATRSPRPHPKSRRLRPGELGDTFDMQIVDDVLHLEPEFDPPSSRTSTSSMSPPASSTSESCPKEHGVAMQQELEARARAAAVEMTQARHTSSKPSSPSAWALPPLPSGVPRLPSIAVSNDTVLLVLVVTFLAVYYYVNERHLSRNAAIARKNAQHSLHIAAVEGDEVSL